MGWVKNTSRGTVAGVVQGEQDKLELMYVTEYVSECVSEYVSECVSECVLVGIENLLARFWCKPNRFQIAMATLKTTPLAIITPLTTTLLPLGTAPPPPPSQRGFHGFH